MPMSSGQKTNRQIRRFPARAGLICFVLALLAILLAPVAARADNLTADQWIQKGQAFLKAQKYSEAYVAFQQALKEAPRYDRAHAAMGAFYNESLNADKAINEYELAAANNPKEPEYPFVLGTLREGKRDYKKALVDFQSAVKLDKNYHQAYFHIGQIHASQGQLPEAQQSYEQALSCSPPIADQATYQLALGDLMLHMGKEKEALADYQKILSGIPKDSKEYQKASAAIAAIKSLHRTRLLKLVGLIVLIVALLGGGVFFGLQFLKSREVKPAAAEEVPRERKQTSDLDGVAQYCLRKLLSLAELPKGVAWLANREQTQMLPGASTLMDADGASALEINSKELPAWLERQQGLPFLLNAEKKENSFLVAFPGARGALEAWDMRVGVPLVHGERLVGMVFAGCRKPSDAAGLRKVFAANQEAMHNLATEVAEAIESMTQDDLSKRDELTGAFNRPHFDEVLPQTLQKMKELKHPASLIIIDIDNFRQLNETYGAPQGDQVLKDLVPALGRCIREGVDVLARIGGEEFGVIIPSASIEAAGKFAEKMRTTVASMSLPAPLPKVTVSLGVAGFPKHARTAEELIAAAEEGLAQAKQEGRNRVAISSRKLTPDEVAPAPAQAPQPEEIGPEKKELEFPTPSWEPVSSGEPITAPAPAPPVAPAVMGGGIRLGAGQPAPASASSGGVSGPPPAPGLPGAPPVAPWGARATPAAEAGSAAFKPGRGLLRRTPPTPVSPWGGAATPQSPAPGAEPAQPGWSVQPPPVATPWGTPAPAPWGATANTPGAYPGAQVASDTASPAPASGADAMKSAGLEPISSEPANDPVSKFFTQSYFHYKLVQEMTQAYHQQKPCAVMFFTIDHLDVVENRRGKARAEEVVREVADTVNDFLREGSDLPGSYGETVFSIILPRTSSKIALNLAEQMRQTIESMGMGEPEEPIRLSAGIAAYPEQATSPVDLVKFGQEAMALAVEGGGNQTVIYKLI